MWRGRPRELQPELLGLQFSTFLFLSFNFRQRGKLQIVVALGYKAFIFPLFSFPVDFTYLPNLVPRRSLLADLSGLEPQVILMNPGASFQSSRRISQPESYTDILNWSVRLLFWRFFQILRQACTCLMILGWIGNKS